MSAVSISVTPSSTARRTTRTPSSRSPTTRIAPKPSRRTSTSPPSLKVGFTAPTVVVERGEQAMSHVQVRRHRGVPAVRVDRDSIAARVQTYRRVELAARVEVRTGDDLPPAVDPPPHRDRSARGRRHRPGEKLAAGGFDLELRCDGHTDHGPAHIAGGEAVERPPSRLDRYALGAVDDLQPLPPARADPPLQRRVPHAVQTGRQGQPVTVCDLRTAAGERELAELEPRRV